LRHATTVLVLLTAASVMTGCGPDGDDGCPEGPVFTHHVVSLDSIAAVEPLGNLTPPATSSPPTTVVSPSPSRPAAP